MADILTTKVQREILSHALGLDYRLKDHRRNRLKQDDEYRNYFCTEKGSKDETEVLALIEKGLMTRGHEINNGTDFYAFVTEAGRKEVNCP